MARAFSATGDIATTASLVKPTAGTIVMLTTINNITSRMRLCGVVNSGTDECRLDFRGDQAGDYFLFSRGRATTFLTIQADSGNFSNFATGVPLWIVVRWDASGTVATDQTIHLATLNGPLVAPSSYTTQTAGTGAVNTASSAWSWGNNNSFGLTVPLVGTLSEATLVNARMTDNEFYAFRQTHVCASRLMHHMPGLYQSGTSWYDLSGNGRTATQAGTAAGTHAAMAWPFPALDSGADAYAASAPPPSSTRAWFLPLLGAA